MHDMPKRPPANASGATAARPVVLRGATLLSAPFTLVGIIAASLALFGLLWTVSEDNSSAPGWVWVGVFTALALLGFAAARGTRVVIRDGVLRDVVAWQTIRRTPVGSIRAVRVRRGLWRTFEMVTDDGARRVVLGAGPVQFPSYLLPGARERDLAAIDAMVRQLRT